MAVRVQWVLLCVLVLVGCVVAPLPIAAAAGTTPFGPGGATLQDDPGERSALEDADEIHIDVFIHENGSATFTVDYRYTIDENRSSEEWDTLRTDVETNADAYATGEADRWSEILAEGQAETEREMALSDVSVETDTSTAPREVGHVAFRFEWSSFAHVELNRIEAGDAISGFTLPEDTTLQFHWPEAYTIYEGPDPSPDDSNDNSVFWDDEGTEFASDQPRIVLIENAADETEPDDGDGGPAVPWLAVAAALLFLVTVGAAGWWIRGEQVRTRRLSRKSSPESSSATADRTADGGQPEGPPPELLSNEERVLRLLDEQGGRIKQQAVVSELGWTEAKTSQVVSGLREAEAIEVFRVGRENVLVLPEDEDENEDGS